MIQLLVSAPASGSGKTTVTCALLAALKKRGYEPCAFKCGPDYIDPMFHCAVLGVESGNLDLFFSSPDFVRELYARGAAGHTAAVCEGAMGYYDGLGGASDKASAWHTAEVLGLPALLVVRPKGASLTLAAQIRGILAYRTPSRIAGVLLNDCTESLYKLLAPMLEKECGVPALGYMPRLPEAAFASRHLGLYTAAEIADLQQKIELLADMAQNTVDWPRFLRVFEAAAPSAPKPPAPAAFAADIAVARDEAFCFAYSEALRALEQAGARLRFFSPLKDSALPKGAGGLYLTGGYPEIYARELAENKPMLAAVKNAVRSGIPTVAECGGFLYLGRELEGGDGKKYPMVGVFGGSGFDTGRLVRFGYAELCADSDSLLLRKGEKLPVHEFHHWDSTENGSAFIARKPVSGREWSCGFANEHLYAGVPHFYWAGTPLPEGFVSAAAKYAKARGEAE